MSAEVFIRSIKTKQFQLMAAPSLAGSPYKQLIVQQKIFLYLPVLYPTSRNYCKFLIKS